MPVYWEDRIIKAVAKNAFSWIEIGLEFLAAKKALKKKGDWERLFAAGKISIRLRVAQRLMAIARNPVLLKTTNSSFLPSSPDALYELSKLPPTVLEAAIAEHSVTPALTITQARNLAQAQQDSQNSSGKPKQESDFDELVDDSTKYLKAKLGHVDYALIRRIVPELIGVLQQLLKRSSASRT